MNKRAIAILGAIFLLIVGTLGFIVYTKYFSDSEAETTLKPISKELAGENPEATTGASAQGGAVAKLSEERVISPVLFYDGTGLTYLSYSGAVYRNDFVEGEGGSKLAAKQMLDIVVKPNISKIYWPPSGKNFIATITNPAGVKQFSFFNNTTNAYTDLPAQIISFDWLPDGNKIYYVWSEGGKATLNVSEPDNKNWQQISELWEPDNEIKLSPDGKNLAYFRTGNRDAANPINLTTPDGKVWKTLVGDGYNFGVLWSPDGQKFLFAKKDSATLKYQLWVYNVLNSEAKNLSLFTTVSKTVWGADNTTVYAAVPSVGTAGEGGLTVDTIVKINTATLNKKDFSPFTEQVDAQDMFLSSDGSKLYFRNAQDGYLYVFDLTK